MTQHLIAYGVVWLLGGFAATLLLLLAIRFGFMAAFVKHLRGFFVMLKTPKEIDFLSRGLITIGMGNLAFFVGGYRNIVYDAVLIITGYAIIYIDRKRSNQ